MSKICDWYRDNSCDCFCDGLDANCKNYSGDLLSDKDKKETTPTLENIKDKLRYASELNDVFPISTGKEEINYNNCHKWYMVQSLENVEMLEKMYNSTFNNLRSIISKNEEPQIVCISYNEDFEEEDLVDDAECYLLSEMKKETISFWKKFGFDVEFKKSEEC